MTADDYEPDLLDILGLGEDDWMDDEEFQKFCEPTNDFFEDQKRKTS